MICLWCHFVRNSHAQGCYGIVTTEAPSAGENVAITILRCASCSSTPAQCRGGVSTGTYTAYVYDIESDGQPSLASAAVIIRNISVTGFMNSPTPTIDLNTTSISGSWTHGHIHYKIIDPTALCFELNKHFSFLLFQK